MNKVIEHVDLSSSSTGTIRRLKVHRYGVPGSRPKAYFQAALHADEYPGLLVAHHLVALLDQVAARDEILGEIVVVPVANPIGLDQRVNDQHLGRFELTGGGNFNRSWPDLTDGVYQRVKSQLTSDEQSNVLKIRQALAEEVSVLPTMTEFDCLRKTLLELSIGADLVFDLHCDNEALFHLYASAHHRELAAELGCDLAAAVVLLETEPGGSPFDECNAGVWWKLNARIGPDYPVPNACFATTVELRGEVDVTDDLAREDAQALLRFLQRRGVVKGEPGPLPDALCEPTPLEGTDVVRAPASGILVYHRHPGDRVEAGEVIAELIDPMADNPQQARIPIRSKANGLLFARMSDRFVRSGAQIFKVAGNTPLEHRKPGQLLEA